MPAQPLDAPAVEAAQQLLEENYFATSVGPAESKDAARIITKAYAPAMAELHERQREVSEQAEVNELHQTRHDAERAVREKLVGALRHCGISGPVYRAAMADAEKLEATDA